MPDKKLLEILACPKCRKFIRFEEERGIICDNCQLIYPVRADVPVMLIEEATEIKK